ncbi:MAG: hypothetical protein DWQ06_09680 [Calditrichaeota bacterium]|nr:MAG: hypothetical protein DWQ06_09680 [Calditrichota bacterium]
MKKLLLLFTILGVAAQSLFSQNIDYVEFFIDTDPGFGNGTNIPITISDSVEVNYNVDLNGISNGMHILNIRAKDENGLWSIHAKKFFLKEAISFNTQITELEHFFDSDPGFGNGANVPIPSGDSVLVNYTADLSSLSNGLHTLNIRAKDENGLWSHHTKKTFIKESISSNSLITELEYFFDSDPGFGNGMNIPISSGDSVLVNYVVDLTPVSNGFHNLNVRAKDENGLWSLLTKKSFLKESAISNPQITKLEYFIDNDPGFGFATNVPIPISDDVTKSFVVDLNGISDGIHKIQVRAKDENGLWSHLNKRLFLKETSQTAKNITKLEYYYTKDSSKSNRINYSSFTPSTDVNLFLSTDLTNLDANTNYTLHVIGKDENNVPSHYFKHDFTTEIGTPSIDNPTELFATNITSDSLVLNWAGTSYEFEIHQNGATIYSGSETNFKVTNLAPNSTYNFSVFGKALGTNTVSQDSILLTFTTPDSGNIIGTYTILDPTECDANYCFHDETNTQLTDGISASTPFNANLGNGSAYEWVGWTTNSSPEIIFDFTNIHYFYQLTIGTYQSTTENIFIPDSLQISYSEDGVNFTFSETLPTISSFTEDSHNTISFSLSGKPVGRFAKINFIKNTPIGTTLVDEIIFNGFPYLLPTANFVASNPSANCGTSVTFDAQTSTSGSGFGISNYQWDFENDGIFDANGQTVIYPITALADTVHLKITNSDGIESEITKNFSWSYTASAPIADAGKNYQVVEGYSLTLNASATTDLNENCGTESLSYTWDLNGDGIFGEANGETPTVSWATLSALNYFPQVPFTISVKVTDQDNLTSTASTSLTIFKDSPIANLLANPSSVTCSGVLELDASATIHPNSQRTIVQYDWDFENDGTYDFTNSNPLVNTSYNAFGTYTAKVKVTDDNGSSDSTTTTILVNLGNTQPIANAGGSYSLNAFNDLVLDGTASFDADSTCGDSIVSYKWDLNNDGIFGDVTGKTPTVYWSLISSLSVPGTYPISLKVTDTLGGNSVASTTLAISPSAGTMACFDGSSRIEVPNLINNQTAFTIEAWFNFTDNNSTRWIYGTGSGFTDVGIAVSSTSNNLAYYGKTATSSFVDQLGSISLTAGSWNHIAFVFDGTNWTGYLNGVQDFQITESGTVTTVSTQAFGQGNWNSGEGFLGELDELRIWDSAQTQAQIQARMNLPLLGNESNLVAYYNLNQISGPTVNDVSANGNSGTFVGTECFVPSTTPLSGSTTFTNNNPTLSFVGIGGFANSIVEPDTGSSETTFQFAIDYFDSDGDFPAIGFPKLLLDFNGDGDFLDNEDLNFTMFEENPSDTTVTNGKRYIYFANGLAESSNWKTQVIAQDVKGGSSSTAFLTEPYISNDLLDISIFANDINFSSLNPQVGDTVTISATVHNNSDFNAENFVVSLYEEDTFVSSYTIPSLSYHSQTTISWQHVFSVDNFYPMKIVLDESNVLTEDNELNNFAIRPVLVGNYVIPGNIVVQNDGLSPSTVYPYSTVRVFGNAQYSGVFGSDFDVSGATVNFQIVETGASFSGNTNGNGDFGIYFTAPTPGTYTIVGTVTDYTLTGNFGPLALTVLPLASGPDLHCEINLNNYSPIVGNTVSGTATVTNSGVEAAGAFNFRIANCEGLIANHTISGLAPNSSQTFNFTSTFPNVGGCSVSGFADNTNIVSELVETNNSSSKGVNVLPDQPDLTPSNSQIYGSYLTGSTVNLSAKIQNIGGIGSGQFDVNVYDNGTLIHTESISALAAQSQTSFSFSNTFTTLGNHAISVKVDEPIGSGFVTEWNENNNVYTGSINVYQLPPVSPNLTISGLSVNPATPTNPGSLDLIATISNNGSDGISVGDSIELNFTVNENGNSTTYTVLDTLGFAKKSSKQLTFTIPTPVFGNNHLYASVDPNNLVSESNENDNLLDRPLCWDFYNGDIPNSNLFWEVSHFSGEEVNLSLGLYNNGLYTGSTVESRFFVDGNFVGSDTETNITPTFGYYSFFVTGQTVSYTFPSAGIYTVEVQTDFPNQWTECNENNNTFSVQVTVVDKKPDLRILSQHISPTELNPDVNEPIGIYLSYENIGEIASDSFFVRCQVDDIQLGTDILVPGLAVGEDTTIAVNATWNSSNAGAHIIRGFVDFFNTVAESNELNNEASRAVIVGESPNLKFTYLNFSDNLPEIGDQITISAEIVNEGDLSCDAELIFSYQNDFGNLVPIGNQTVTVPQKDTLQISFQWTVLDSVTTINGKIVNASPQEFNPDDNEINEQLGPVPFVQMSISKTSFAKDFTTGSGAFVDTLVISNSGTETLSYTIFSASNLISESKGSGNVIPSGTDTVFVSLGNATTDLGTYYGTIVVNSNDLNASQTLIPVTLNYHGSKIAVDILGVNFGTVFNGTTNSGQVNISNLGDLPLTVTGIDVLQNSLSVDTSAFVIQPNAIQTVNVSWKPLGTESLLEVLTIHSDDFNDSLVTFTAIGNSVEAAHFFSFDHLTTLPNNWNSNASAGNPWQIMDEGNGDKSVQADGTTTLVSSKNKNGNQILSLVETTLESPIYDFTNFTNVNLMFYHNYILGSEISPEGGFVELSTDGGNTFPNQIAYYNSSTSGNEDFDISSLVSGQSGVQVRFNYKVSNGVSWTVDDFFIGDTTTLINVPPTQIDTVLVLGTTLTSFELGWTPSYDVNFDSYEIFYAETFDFANAVIWTVAEDSLLSDYQTNNTEILNVFPRTYWVKMRGIDKLGNVSAFTNPIRVEMDGLISGFEISTVGSQIQLSWDEPNFAELLISGYNVYRSEEADFIPSLLNQVTTNVTDNDLFAPKIQWNETATLSGSAYFYSVTANGTVSSPVLSNSGNKFGKKGFVSSSAQNLSKKIDRRKRQLEVKKILEKMTRHR